MARPVLPGHRPPRAAPHGRTPPGGGRRRRPGLLGLDDAAPLRPDDRGRGTPRPHPRAQFHELIEYLCDVSESVLFLSATPVHLGSRNLFALLNLLRPDLFPTQAVFDEMVRPNGSINTAMRLAGSAPRASRGRRMRPRPSPTRPRRPGDARPSHRILDSPSGPSGSGATSRSPTRSGSGASATWRRSTRSPM